MFLCCPACQVPVRSGISKAGNKYYSCDNCDFAVTGKGALKALENWGLAKAVEEYTKKRTIADSEVQLLQELKVRVALLRGETSD